MRDIELKIATADDRAKSDSEKRGVEAVDGDDFDDRTGDDPAVDYLVLEARWVEVGKCSEVTLDALTDAEGGES